MLELRREFLSPYEMRTLRRGQRAAVATWDCKWVSARVIGVSDCFVVFGIGRGFRRRYRISVEDARYVSISSSKTRGSRLHTKIAQLLLEDPATRSAWDTDAWPQWEYLLEAA